MGELVSASHFPVVGENTGKFCRSKRGPTEVALACGNKFKVFSPNSLAIEAGNFAD